MTDNAASLPGAPPREAPRFTYEDVDTLRIVAHRDRNAYMNGEQNSDYSDELHDLASRLALHIAAAAGTTTDR